MAHYHLLLACVISLVAPLNAVRVPVLDVHKGSMASATYAGPRKLQDKCEVYFRNRTLDHFSWGPTDQHKETYRQRYFLCKDSWKPGGPIFLYLGNEADVTLYLEHTGLMWENADDFGALLVFAEHRYYGESKPYKKDMNHHLQYLTSEQALADYAELIFDLKIELKAHDSAVIGFGGSYGGMLTAWMRLKYPHILDGGIAGSAPIWTYLGEDPSYDSNGFARVVTRDATPDAGSAAACAPNVRAAWPELLKRGETHEGRASVREAMRICKHSRLDSPADVALLAAWASDAWSSMAMGDYPFPSSYILNGVAELPTFPVQAACSYLAEPELQEEELLAGLAAAVSVFYNASGSSHCLDYDAAPNPASAEVGELWGYQYCTENFMPFSTNGKLDMFWDAPFDVKAAEEACQQQYGVTPRPLWASVQWGGRELPTLSNLVFSNGLLDPWSSGGVLQSLSDSVVAVIIPEGAHHLDLMFSNEEDPASVKAARQVEVEHMRRWVQQKALAVQKRDLARPQAHQRPASSVQ